MGWANYLSSFGYFPTIVTRNWDLPINSPEDALLSSGQELKHEKNEKYEVFYLPYKASKRDEIYSKNKENRNLQKISKLFTLNDLVFENYSNRFIPFANMYEFAREKLKKDSSYQLVLISGNPFIQFKFGYQLHKEFGIKWIADYRDDWNTSELTNSNQGIQRIISKIQAKSEKKWVDTAECITSVSKIYADKIGQFVDKKGSVILNGFDGIDTEEIAPQEKVFQITYNGSLYPTQPIEKIIEAIKKIISNKELTLEIRLNFPGLGFDKFQKARVEKAIVGIEKFVKITDRIPKQEVIRIQKESDVLLMISHTGIKGIPSSKMYEYIGLKKPILLYPNDHDIVEETLLDSGLGIVCNQEVDIYENLVELIKAKQEGKISTAVISEDKMQFYSRKNQTAELAKLIDNVLSVDVKKL